MPALGHEIIDAALPVLVARVPVLYGRILDLRVLHRNQFHNRRMQLVAVTQRRGAAFEIGNIAVILGHDQRALELTGLHGVDAKIG